MEDSLQDQLTTTKKDHILKAAAHVFAHKGFHAATVRDIARAAGVADGTLYNYFENKSALLLSLFDRTTQATLEEVDPALLGALDLRDFISAYVRQPLQAFRSNDAELFKVVMSEIMVNQALAERFSAQLLGPMIEGAEGFAQSWAARNGVVFRRSDLTMRVISGLIIGLSVQRVLGDEVLIGAWDELPDLVADLLIEGLVLDEA